MFGPRAPVMVKYHATCYVLSFKLRNISGSWCVQLVFQPKIFHLPTYAQGFFHIVHISSFCHLFPWSFQWFSRSPRAHVSIIFHDIPGQNKRHRASEALAAEIACCRPPGMASDKLQPLTCEALQRGKVPWCCWDLLVLICRNWFLLLMSILYIYIFDLYSYFWIISGNLDRSQFHFIISWFHFFCWPPVATNLDVSFNRSQWHRQCCHFWQRSAIEWLHKASSHTSACSKLRLSPPYGFSFSTIRHVTDCTWFLPSFILTPNISPATVSPCFTSISSQKTLDSSLKVVTFFYANIIYWWIIWIRPASHTLSHTWHTTPSHHTKSSPIKSPFF